MLQKVTGNAAQTAQLIDGEDELLSGSGVIGEQRSEELTPLGGELTHHTLIRCGRRLTAQSEVTQPAVYVGKSGLGAGLVCRGIARRFGSGRDLRVRDDAAEDAGSGERNER